MLPFSVSTRLQREVLEQKKNYRKFLPNYKGQKSTDQESVLELFQQNVALYQKLPAVVICKKDEDSHLSIDDIINPELQSTQVKVLTFRCLSAQ